MNTGISPDVQIVVEGQTVKYRANTLPVYDNKLGLPQALRFNGDLSDVVVLVILPSQAFVFPLLRKESIGVNISEQKRGTTMTKKRESAPAPSSIFVFLVFLVFFECATGIGVLWIPKCLLQVAECAFAALCLLTRVPENVVAHSLFEKTTSAAQFSPFLCDVSAFVLTQLIRHLQLLNYIS